MQPPPSATAREDLTSHAGAIPLKNPVHLASWLVLLSAAVALSQSSSAPPLPAAGSVRTPIPVFGTGYLPGGPGLAAPGAADGNFTLIACPPGACGTVPFITLTGGYPFPPWMPNTAAAQWIGPDAAGDENRTDATGLYVYRQTFDLTAFDLSTVTLDGAFAADNSSLIQLNGAPVGPASPTYTATTPFTLNSGFRQGINTLDFLVTNDPPYGVNPSGLYVELRATGVVSPLDFALFASPSAQTIYAGEPAAFTITVAPGQGMTETVALRCEQLPANTTCSFTPPVVGAGQWTSKLVFQTSAPAPLASASSPTGRSFISLLAAFALLIPLHLRRLRDCWPTLPLVLAFLGAANALSGCGAPGPLGGGTSVGTHLITVSGTASNPLQSLTHSTTVTLNTRSLF